MDKNPKMPFMVDVFSAIIKKEYIDVSMTEKVQNHIRQKNNNFLEIEESSDDIFYVFEKMNSIYKDLLSCDDTANPYYQGNALLNDKIEASKILSDFRIKMTSYMAFSLCDEDNNRIKNRKYFIIIFNNTILLFIKPCNKPATFLCALKPEAFNISFKTKTRERTVAVNETSRESIEYYKKFNPVPDSKILSLNWAVTNRDGSRSFRG